VAGQAAVELAVFGAIGIFIIGAFPYGLWRRLYAKCVIKSMRYAAESWHSAKAGFYGTQFSSVLFIEKDYS